VTLHAHSKTTLPNNASSTAMVSSSTHTEELYQMRLLLEQQLLSADLDDERTVAGLLQQVDWLQACCGERQLTHGVSSSIMARLSFIDFCIMA
jgi:hypothetical protein